MNNFLKYLIYIILIFQCNFAYAQDIEVKPLKAEPIVEKIDSVTGFQLYSQESLKPIIDSALKHLGTPYKWGATGNGAFDCSGFTRHVFLENGYVLPRVSKDQSKMGLTINSLDSVQSGDLIFFAGRTDLKNVHHVGIVKEKNQSTGEIMFIHASCRKGVTISSLNTDYYSKRYIRTQRILKN